MAIINDLPCVSGGGLTKELLWTNPNPTQAMGNTTITVPNISEYDYIMFETAVAPRSTTISDLVYQTLCRVEDIEYKVGNYYGRPLTLSCVYDNAGAWTTFQRLVVWNSMTACNFQSCVQFGTQSTFNGLNVPLRVYGVKGEIN